MRACCARTASRSRFLTCNKHHRPGSLHASNCSLARTHALTTSFERHAFLLFKRLRAYPFFGCCFFFREGGHDLSTSLLLAAMARRVFDCGGAWLLPRLFRNRARVPLTAPPRSELGNGLSKCVVWGRAIYLIPSPTARMRSVLGFNVALFSALRHRPHKAVRFFFFFAVKGQNPSPHRCEE